MKTPSFFATLMAFFLLGLSFSGVAYSETITLDAALAAARNHNPELKKMKLEADAAHWQKLSAISGHLPHIMARGQHALDAKYDYMLVALNPSSPLPFAQAYPQTTFSFDASITLFDGFETYNNYRAASFSSEAADLDYKRAQFKLTEMVQIKFLQAVAAGELALVAAENIKTLEDHLKLVQAGRHAGISTNYDVLRIESQLEEARAEKLLADDNVADTKRVLLDVIGVDDSEVVLQGTLPPPDLARVPKDLHLDLSKREDVVAQTSRELASGRRNSAALGFWSPKIDFYASKDFYHFGSFDSLILDRDGYQSGYSYGLRATWNIFDGGRSIAQRAAADDAYEASRQTSRRTTLTSINEFETYKRRYLYNCMLFQARQRTVEKSQESVRLATIGVKAGVKTNSEAIDAELDLFRARAGVVRAQVDASEALSNLELAVGHTL